MENASILIIEDDDIVAQTIERCLRRGHFNVTSASSGVEGLKQARRTPPDLIVLDVIMPGMDGYTVCKEIRSDPLLSTVPILFLTAKAKDEDKITGLRLGADDYLGKPFNVDELILRITAILRRSHQDGRVQAKTNSSESDSKASSKKTRLEDSCLTLRGYSLNTRTYELITPKETRIRLTPVQYDLLYHLMLHPGEIFSPSRLLDEVWDYPSDTGSPDLVRVHIKNLRDRVEPDPHSPSFIETVPGYGYTIRS